MRILCLVGQYWLFSFEEVLRKSGFQGECHVFHSVSEAREYIRTHGGIDIFLIEDCIVVNNDGMEWGTELHQTGRPVLMLADFETGGPPRFSKIIVGGVGERSLLAKLYEVHSSVSA